MAKHEATISWKRTSDDFSYKTYNREHQWSFPGGSSFTATAAPAYLGKPEFVDPEEAFVASLSSCHMLTFLAFACKKNFVVDEYTDYAEGYLEKNEQGKLAITRVVLRPKVTFQAGTEVSAEALAELHERSHHECFIANSVTTQIRVEAQE